MPGNLTTQKSSFRGSQTTVKHLVALDTFYRSFVYISPGFSGNSSDRFSIQHSGILDELKPGQRILADKGYNAQDLLLKRGVLTILSFLSEGRLTAQEGMQSQTTVNARIGIIVNLTICSLNIHDKNVKMTVIWLPLARGQNRL